MKKCIALLMIIGIFFLPQTAKSQGATQIFDLSFSSGILVGDTSLNSIISGVGVKSDLNTGFIITGRADYFLYDNVGVEMNIGISSNNVDFNSAGLSTDIDSGQYHFDVGPIFRYPVQNIDTFFHIGLGFMAFNMDNSLPGVTTDDNTTQFKINLGGGVKYFLTHNMGVRFELRDHIVFLTDDSFWGPSSENFLNLIEISGGIFYNFF
jgi:opacity protein-like surface antigen